MAKRLKPEDITYDISEFMGTLKESDQSDWAKAVVKISWNSNPTTVDIRNINLCQGKIGKGISLTDEEADRLVDILLDNEYGSLPALKSAIEKKKNRFKIVKNTDEYLDEPIDIKINMR